MLPSAERPSPRVVAVVQARWSSARLPGKVLRPLGSRPLVGHLLDVLRHAASLDGIVLATSREASDDAVAAFAEREGVSCHRGSLTDVARRVLEAATSAGAQVLVRLSGDSPLLDPALVDRAVDVFRTEGGDLVSNVVVRSFPKGQSVELITCEALATAVAAMRTDDEREHVTPYCYTHPERFVIRSLTAPRPRPEVQLSVDTLADLDRCEAILASLDGPPWQAGWEACVRASDRVAVLAAKGHA
jgi:spore coat polysaccharide biosynthesis protein SpsF